MDPREISGTNLLAMEFRQVPNERKAATSTDFYRELHSHARHNVRIFRSRTSSTVEYEISVRYVKVVRLVRSRAKRANTRGDYSLAVDAEDPKTILRITSFHTKETTVGEMSSLKWRVGERKDPEHGNRIPTRLNLQEAAEVALRAE
ncbi:hypothetical protein V1478_011702, partial [Vespula squamosa]